MLTRPKYGWADFQIAGSPTFPLSYLIADLAYKWLDSAIDGLEHGKPFSVEGEMEPELFVCDVDFNSCRIRQYSGWVPSDLKFARTPTDLVFDCTYPVSMIEFCKSLYADISENVDDWADFQMDRGNEWFDSEVFGKARQLLLEKLAHLRSILESKGVDPDKRTLDELYSRIQIRKLSEVCRTNPRFDWEYCPIVIAFPNGCKTVSCSDGNETSIHIKYAYMIELWRRVKAWIGNEFPGFLNHAWTRKGYFNSLSFTNRNHDKAIKAFWNNLERMANSGEVKVKESCIVDGTNNLTLVCKSYGGFTNSGHHYSKQMRSYVCGDEEYSFRWDEVKKYFIELTAPEVAFLRGREMNPIDEKDDSLHKACSDRDYDAVVKAVEAGADVNGFDKYGDTSLNSLFYEDTVEYGLEKINKYDPEYTDNLIKIADYLISKGADINLYGFDANDLLTTVHFSSNLRVMKYLCKHGIRRDLNCFICDLYDMRQWYTPNAAYSYVEDDIGCGFYDTPNVREQEKILENYGVNDWLIDGWTGDKLPDLYAENTERQEEEQSPNRVEETGDGETKLVSKAETSQKNTQFRPKPFVAEEHQRLLGILADAWTRLDATELLKYIHPSFQYDSQWVFRSMFADEYPSYITGKFATIKRTGSNVIVRIVPDPYYEGNMIRMEQGADISYLRIECSDGMIYKMDMCMF